MTTLALFSDVHASRPALEAVLATIDAREPDGLYCLGDLVGYAPWPNEVVEMIRTRRIPTIAGNYDEGVGVNSPDCGCAYTTEEDEARGEASIAYTNEVITEANRAFLRGLPRHLRLEYRPPRSPEGTPLTVLFVHGSARRINEYLFEDRPDRSFLRMMAQTGADVMCFGHTHKPYHKALSYETDAGELRYRHAINIGSVGKPKDGDPRGCYVALHIHPEEPADSPERVQPEFVRVAYPVEAAATAVEDSPLPSAFADMLQEAN